MNVVCHSTGGDQGETLAPRDAAEIGEKIGHAVGGNEWPALFCAEDAVDEIAGIRVGHARTVPRGLTFYNVHSFPKLKRGANDHCASGAQWCEHVPRRCGNFSLGGGFNAA